MRQFVVLLLLFCLSFYKTLAQPSAILDVSGQTVFCETGTVTFKVKFSGDDPFGFAYTQVNEDGTGKTIYEINQDIFSQDLNDGWYEFQLQFDQSATVKLVKVWDATIPSVWDKNNNGISITDQPFSVTIDQMPNPSIGTYSPSCGTSIALNALPDAVSSSYTWTATGGTFTDATIAKPVFTSTNNAEGTFNLVFTQQNGSCSATRSVDVVLRSTPMSVISGSKSVCLVSGAAYQLDANVQLTGHAPLSYTITDGSKTYTRTAQPDGNSITQVPATADKQTYFISSVKDVNGCNALATDMTGTATVTDLSPTAFAGDDAVVCGLDAQISASLDKGIGSWSVVTNEPEVSIADLSNAKTSLSATAYGESELKWTANNEGCVHSDNVKVLFNMPASLAMLKEKQVITHGQSATMQVELSGVSPWLVEYLEDGESRTTEFNSPIDFIEVTPLQSTTYLIEKVTGANGCADLTEKSFFVSVETFKTYNGFSPNGDGVNEFFEVDGLNEGMNGELTVFDQKGTVVYKQSDYDNSWNGVGLDGQPLADGIYYYEFKSALYSPVRDYVVIKRHSETSSNQ